MVTGGVRPGGVLMATTAYDRLLCEVRPEVIENDGRYDEVAARLAELVRKGTAEAATRRG